MILSDQDIRFSIDTGLLVVEPFNEKMIQPCSLDVRLSNSFKVFDWENISYIEPANIKTLPTLDVTVADGDYFLLNPGEFVIASTIEYVEIPDNMAAKFEGKSSLGRIGLSTHQTAGWIDAGFCGEITLEISSEAKVPSRLYPGMKIGQLCFMNLTSPAQKPYGHPDLGSHYQYQRGPTSARSTLT